MFINFYQQSYKTRQTLTKIMIDKSSKDMKINVNNNFKQTKTKTKRGGRGIINIVKPQVGL